MPRESAIEVSCGKAERALHSARVALYNADRPKVCLITVLSIFKGVPLTFRYLDTF